MLGVKLIKRKSYLWILVIAAIIIVFLFHKSKIDELKCSIDELKEQVNALKAKLDKLSQG